LITKTYAALVRGTTSPKGILTDFLWKDEKTNTVSVVPSSQPKAKKAILTYQLATKKDGISLLLLNLETGRPHQIRVQLAHAGFPLLGDAKYGTSRGRTESIELKSIQLGFEHPTLKKALLFQGLIRDSAHWLLF
jgi:23S rRNA pseudouridine1911/1915/1917 synthase